LLKERNVPHRYREYTKEPLGEEEVRALLRMLDVPAKAIFRKRDGKKLGLTGDEGDDVLIPAMAEHPTLIQRPIGILNGKAVVGRPVENLLTIV
jgi:arsenate reductase